MNRHLPKLAFRVFSHSSEKNMWSSEGDSHEERLFTRTMSKLYAGETLGSILMKSTWRDRVLILKYEKKLVAMLDRFKMLVGESDR